VREPDVAGYHNDRSALLARPGQEGELVSWGTLYGIGMGPGDPELLTRKAYRLLATVPVIFYPACGGKAGGVALEILQRAFTDQGIQASSTLPTRCLPVLERCQPLPITMVRGSDRARPHWWQAAATVGKVLQSGMDAAFITEGDPLVYSTFVYLRLALAERFPEAQVEVIPGVSSITAAAARTAFPLAVANERFAILPATYDPIFLERALEAFDTVVLLKVHRVLDRLIAILETRSLLANAVLVEHCGTPRERIVRDLTTLRGQPVDYFSLLLVRKHRDPEVPSPPGRGRKGVRSKELGCA
jgi:precorrin-2/cobalt-factor-2 C20-methyltransferase